MYSAWMDSNYDPLYPDHPVVDQYLSTWANFCTFADKPVFKWVDEDCKETDSITYRELNAAASTVASRLRQRSPVSTSFARGDRVLLIYPPGLDFIKVLFGCQRAGLVIIPVSPPHPANCSRKDVERLARICREATPRAVLSPSGYSALLRKRFMSEGGSRKDVPDQWIDILAESSTATLSQGSEIPVCGCRAEDIFLVQYTSGTTGQPKPTLVSAGSAAHNVRAARRAYELGPATVIATWLPQYHDCGLVFTLLTVVCGATAVMASPKDFAKRPCLWLDMISSFQASCTVVPAFALTLTLRRFEKLVASAHQEPANVTSRTVDGGNHVSLQIGASAFVGADPTRQHRTSARLNLATLQNLIIINEPICSNVVNDFRKTFSRHGLRGSAIGPSYGLAENCTFVCTAWASPSCSYPTNGNLMPVGRLETCAADENSQDMDIKVVNTATCQEAPEATEGEIWVSSPSNASGYLGDPALTHHIFHAKLANSSKRFVRTGDLGKVVQGFLYVTGRVQDVMLVQGQMLHPHDLESSVVDSDSNFRPGCCVAFSNPGVVIVAEVVDEAAYPPGIARMAWQVLKVKHGIQCCTIALVKPRSVPKTTSGKLRRRETRHLFLRNELPLLECTTFQDEFQSRL